MSKPLIPQQLFHTATRWRKLYQRYTHFERVLPSFLIIGTQKGGTSSLSSMLRQHPQILRSFLDEVHYFNNNFYKGLSWYQSKFPSRSKVKHKKEIQTYEKTPSYMFHPLGPPRISSHLPDVKLIILLRNPVTRAYSHFQMESKRENEQYSFGKALMKEKSRLKGEYEKIHDMYHKSYNFGTYSYLSRGLYVRQLDNILQYFPRENLFIEKSETFFSNPIQTVNNIFSFLNLSEKNTIDTHHKREGQYKPMSHSIKKKLQKFYRPFNEKLYDKFDLEPWNTNE